MAGPGLRMVDHGSQTPVCFLSECGSRILGHH